MAKKNYLVNDQTIIDKPAFPLIDAHNHLWGNWQVDRVIKTLDEPGRQPYSSDYDGTFDRARWLICGLDLPKDVLKKIHYENILRIIPSLKKDIILTLK